MDTRFCLSCGTAVPAGARFCPKCGTEFSTAADFAETVPAYVPPPGPRPAPQQPPVIPPPVVPPSEARPHPSTPLTGTKKSNTLVMVAIALVVLVGLALLFLLGMPFGGGDRQIERRQVETETIGEAPPPAGQPPLGATADTGQIEEVPPLMPVPPNTTTNTANNAPLGTPSSGNTPPPVTAPAPSLPPAAAAGPRAVPPPPARNEPEQQGAVTESDATAIVRGAANGYYDGVPGDCLSVVSEGYRNVGYTMAVRDSCRGTALGRWRVDARNGEVFRQRDDGRFLKP